MDISCEKLELLIKHSLPSRVLLRQDIPFYLVEMIIAEYLGMLRPLFVSDCDWLL